jgi:hypothetical protein
VFGDIADVRVGIKTTADEVFIRSDWDALPPAQRPEPRLLRPLLSHEHAQRWTPGAQAALPARILYPHEVIGDGRRPVDLDAFPAACAYLESHRARLERRRYVLEAGRRWYEIWVPQDPSAWAGPKIVFPDICHEPRFYLDLDGRLVNGDCYWITLRPGLPADTMYLLLALANSRLLARFHDLAFNNKLYSGKRRYITQYVAQYPHPALTSATARKLVALVKRILAQPQTNDHHRDLAAPEREADALVEEAFGLRLDQDSA